MERGDFSIASFEGLKKSVKPRLREKEEKLNRIKEKQEAQKNLMLLEASLIPNEANQEKIRRYEAFSDNSMYKALTELEELQAFFNQSD